MCGINGIILDSNSNNLSLNETLKSMNSVILHRGPDQDGFFCEDLKNFSLGMAMQRLSIIDLSTGSQPIFNDDKSIIIVFNGEIYNYKLIRAELEKEGVIFNTSSDTEVILRLFEKRGITSLGILDGMFAFSIYDKKNRKVYIARDFFGEKPLYYSSSQEGFIWTSELKSILKVLTHKPTINTHGLNLFLQLTYIPAPFTIYNDIHKLEANHYIEFDCDTFQFTINEIKHIFKRYENLNKKEYQKITHDMVLESVVSRSVSDVPLGTFLSGGVDSSIVSLCLAQQTNKKIDTYSIGFEKKSFDETDKSRTVAKLIKSNHHEFIISEKDLELNLTEIILNFDEPFGDSSALASYIVANKTRKEVKVALTGDGGDEVFGGYNKYYMGKLNNKYTSLVPKKIHNLITENLTHLLSVNNDNRGKRFKFIKLLEAINYDEDYYYKIISLGFKENELCTILNDTMLHENTLSYFKHIVGNKSKTLTDFRNIDRILSLEGDMLVKVDRTSMLSSLECRAPFLNKEIWNFTNQIPDNLLVNGWDKKYILKEAFKEYFPNNFLNKPKKGFGVPVGDWFRSILKTELLSYVEKSFINKQNIFNYEKIVSLVNYHLTGKFDNTFRVWTYYCFQKWYIDVYGKD